MAKKVVIGIYTGKYVSATFPVDLVRMVMSLSEKGMYAGLEAAESCRVDSNRNRLIYDFLHKSKGDYLFIIDEDMIHPADMPIILAERDLPIVSGLYFRRGNNGMHTPQFYKLVGQSEDTREGHGKAINNFYEPMIKEVHEFFSGLENIPYTNEPLILTDGRGQVLTNSLLEIDGGGFGCLMIRRDALEAMDEPYLQSEPGLNGDLVFYKQAREKGIKVYGDCAVVAKHNYNEGLGVGAFCDFMWRFVEDAQRVKEDGGLEREPGTYEGYHGRNW